MVKVEDLQKLCHKHVVDQLPDNHPARDAIKNRVRLDDKQNKNLYGENISTQAGNKKASLGVLKYLGGKDRELIVCDDSMETGRKVFHTLGELDKAGVSARYTVFSGPGEFSQGSDYLRPEGWEQFKDKVTVGTTQEKAAKTLRGLSGLLSSHTNVRLNKNVHTLGQSIPATIDTLDNEHAHTLRRSGDLMKKLDTALA